MPSAAEAFDDGDYPAYTMGTAADILGVTPAFLRALGQARMITPRRSDGGHRRYSRHELQLAGRVRQLVDEGMSLAAACRVVTLEDQVSGLEDQVTGLEEQVTGLRDRLATANRRIVDLDRDRPPSDAGG
jgi:MerR family transcriptional regulator, heat shock protein HspR